MTHHSVSSRLRRGPVLSFSRTGHWPGRRVRAATGLAALLVALAASLVGPAPAQAFQPAQLAAALEASRTREFDRATQLAGQAGDPVAVDIITWQRLRAGQGSWSEYVTFLNARADWPGLPLMRKRAESVMPAALPAGQVRSFFAVVKPQTARGSMIYSAALGRDAARVERARAWTTLVMSRDGRAQFMARYADELRRSHVDRLDMLLWSGETGAAEEIVGLVPAADAAVARARIALQEQRNGVDGLIAAIPAARAADGGVTYDRFRWRLAKGRRDSAQELMRLSSTSVAALGRPDRWGSTRRSMARGEMRAGNPRLAYELASRHQLTSGSNYADLEWLSGYIALTYLNDPGRAVAHFERFRRAVETPISLGRAGYWLGRAQEVAGNDSAARGSYQFGASFQTSFYGQLAAERIGAQVDGSIARQNGLPGYSGRSFARSTPIRAAQLLQQAGDTLLSARFILHVEESLSSQDAAALSRLSLEIGQTYGAVKIAKRLVRDGVIYPEAYYPVTSLAREARVVRPEEAMAIARQESELNPLAISPAGARGLMQLMPGTAQKVSGELGIGYSLAALTADPGYNGRLGTQYLADMLERFDGSMLLAAAAYNAGPNRVDQWLERYGDPRRPGVDPIRWIEHMPFRETRNYVMRVLESQHIYRARIAGRAGAIGLMAELGMR